MIIKFVNTSGEIFTVSNDDLSLTRKKINRINVISSFRSQPPSYKYEWMGKGDVT